ncbi:MAG: hypothetical protein ACLGGX_01700 [Bdellovibrionia bacterium]
MRNFSLYFIAILLCSLFKSQWTFAQTSLPNNLNAAEREQVAATLGYGLSTKLLSNPYPLGGYEGYEFGVSSEFISLKDLASLGGGSADKGEFTVYNLVFGKGLFYDIDLFVHFAPPFQQENIGVFGFQGRWKFWQSQELPLIASLIVAGGGSQIQSLISNSTVSSDLVVSMVTEDITVYFGGGLSRLITRFTGGPDGLTDDGESYQLDQDAFHSLFGLAVTYNRIYLAFQLDRYVESTYAAKIGYRF